MTPSASEALRGLDGAMTPGPWRASGAWASHLSWWEILAGDRTVAETPRIPERSDDEIPDGREIADLRNALPALIAVVEAAEEVHGNDTADLGGSGREAYEAQKRMWDAMERMYTALTALAGALSDGAS